MYDKFIPRHYPIYPTHAQSLCGPDNLFTETIECAQDPVHTVAAFCWDCHMTFGWDEVPETKKPTSEVGNG